MNKSLTFICFSALLTCVDLFLNFNDDLNGSQIIDNGSLVTDNNITHDELEVELLIPQLSVLIGEQSVSEDAPNSDESNDVTENSSNVSSRAVIKSPQCSIVPNTSRAATFLDHVLGGSDSGSRFQDVEEGHLKYRSGVKKITCIPRNTTDLSGPLSVKIVNSSELLQQLGSRNSTNGQCTIVLFYAPWCIFSAQVAPHYNALARAFPKLDVVAIDAFHFSNLNSRFGTIAVPNVMIFHSAKAIARFNGSERTLACLSSFVSNVTGMQANSSVEVTEEDYVGPLQSEPTQEMDYLLLLSWLFVILCCVMGAVRSSAGVRVWNTLVAMGHHEQHHHQHID